MEDLGGSLGDPGGSLGILGGSREVLGGPWEVPGRLWRLWEVPMGCPMAQMLLWLQPEACFRKDLRRNVSLRLEPLGVLYAKMLLWLQPEAYFSKTLGSTLRPHIRKS